MKDSVIKVLIFEDNPSIREGLRFFLNLSPGFTCVGECENVLNSIEDVKTFQPDVILMDINMPGMSGLDAIAGIKVHFPSIHIIMQTVFEDDEKIFHAIKNGASGYLLKNSDPSKILQSIREIYEGGWPMSPSIASQVLRMFKEISLPKNSDEYMLSKREKEILSLLVDGLSYKQIADKACISYETVHSHVKKIYQKLQVSSMNEAVSKALRNKIV